MLDNLKNVNHKSFDKYTNNDQLTKVNIFFGRNGSGKSSLSEWLKINNEKSVIFNTRYLKNNIEQVEKIDGISKVRKLSKEELNNYSDYYSSVFTQVMSFALKGRGKVTNLNDYIKYANKMRFILESHARSHYKIEYATAASVPELSKYYDIEKERMKDLEKSLDIINSLSHGISFIDNHNEELSVIEVHEAIRKVIGIIYKKDKQHVSAMCSGVLTKENKEELQKWI